MGTRRKDTILVSLDTVFSELQSGFQNGWAFIPEPLSFKQGQTVYAPLIMKSKGHFHTCEQIVKNHFKNAIYRQALVKMILKKRLCTCFSENMFKICGIYKLLYFNEISEIGIIACLSCKIIAIAREKRARFNWELIWYNRGDAELPSQLENMLN